MTKSAENIEKKIEAKEIVTFKQGKALGEKFTIQPKPKGKVKKSK